MDSNIIHIDDPTTKEEFANLSASDKFILKVKWGMDDYYNGNSCGKNKLIFFDAPKEKTCYSLISPSGKRIGEGDSLNKLSNEVNLSSEIISYLNKTNRFYKTRKKFPEYQGYRIESKHFILKDNDYIEKV